METKQEMPVSIVLFLVWVAVGLLSTLQSLVLGAIIFGPFLLDRIASTIFALVFILLYSLVFFGTIKRKKWTRPLAIGIYLLAILVLAFDLISFYLYPQQLNQNLQKFFEQQEFSQFGQDPQTMQATQTLLMSGFFSVMIAFSLVFSIIQFILIAYLMHKKKEYFSE